MKIAIIGLGHMGMGMARNLAKADHRVTAFHLSREAMHAAAEAGMATAASGQEAVGDVEVVITVLPEGKHVLSAYRGEHGGDGLLGAAKKGTLFMDCSTIGVDETREAAHGLGQRLDGLEISSSVPWLRCVTPRRWPRSTLMSWLPSRLRTGWMSSQKSMSSAPGGASAPRAKRYGSERGPCSSCPCSVRRCPSGS
ncbi:MAG: NAD(P)-dependent oxidoreductase [Burkholderiales bacterium]|nr:NAD(P)-dependent oxidoreductase [Burkholderiales bacterium]